MSKTEASVLQHSSNLLQLLFVTQLQRPSGYRGSEAQMLHQHLHQVLTTDCNNYHVLSIDLHPPLSLSWFYYESCSQIPLSLYSTALCKICPLVPSSLLPSWQPDGLDSLDICPVRPPRGQKVTWWQLFIKQNLSVKCLMLVSNFKKNI